MALSNKVVRQLAVGAGALLLGALLGAVWRSTKTRPRPAGTTPQASADVLDAADAGPLALLWPAQRDGGAQIYNTKPDPRLHGVGLRPMDLDIFGFIGSGQLERDRMLDVFPDKPYRVRMIGSLPDHWVSVVLVDLNRDGKWDERWDLKPDDVDRTIFRRARETELAGEPADQRFALRRGLWQGY
jgi:hypothetical protein